MKRGRSTGNPTMADRYRFDMIQEIGCICCLQIVGGYVPAEIHHLTVGGKHGQKRRGHQYTIGLCSYHHRGYPVPWASSYDLGPSYAQQPRAFRCDFGNDDVLLARQNELIAGQMGRVA